MQSIVLGGGCFWCVEAALEKLHGVDSVVSGYAGGETENPTYEEVCSGNSNHAEVVRVQFDPDILSLDDLLKVFFEIHNPTTRNRQGPDVGSQYRSIILYEDEDQLEVIESVRSELEQERSEEFVTEIDSLDTFYRAEEYHQNYFKKNPQQPYCRMNIPPKLKKIDEKFAELAEGST